MDRRAFIAAAAVASLGLAANVGAVELGSKLPIQVQGFPVEIVDCRVYDSQTKDIWFTPKTSSQYQDLHRAFKMNAAQLEDKTNCFISDWHRSINSGMDLPAIKHVMVWKSDDRPEYFGISLVTEPRDYRDGKTEVI